MNDFIIKTPKLRQEAMNMFSSTSPAEQKKSEKEVQQIPVSKLVPFSKHPFKLYTGQQYEDLKESIRLNGILQPLLVRRSGDNDTYEIIAGHNRSAAAKEIGLPEVSAIVMDVDDDDAMFIVIETNLYQRSFSDLSHSERARIITLHMEENKKQGKRTDLINEVKNLLELSNNAESATFRQLGEKLDSTQNASEQYGLSARQISRYLRVDKLSDALKEYVDSGTIAFNVGVELSYLSEFQMDTLSELIEAKGYRIDAAKAKQLRELSADNKLDDISMEQVLNGTYKPKKPSIKRKPISLSSNMISKYFGMYTQDKQVINIIDTSLEIYTENQKYFSEEQTDEEIRDIYKKALEQYFSNSEEENIKAKN